jgi:ferredoxin
MRVKIGEDLCIGSGQCRRTCPEVFTEDELGQVALRTERPPGHLRDAVLRAIIGCPSGAIEAVEDEE